MSVSMSWACWKANDPGWKTRGWASLPIFLSVPPPASTFDNSLIQFLILVRSHQQAHTFSFTSVEWRLEHTCIWFALITIFFLILLFLFFYFLWRNAFPFNLHMYPLATLLQPWTSLETVFDTELKMTVSLLTQLKIEQKINWRHHVHGCKMSGWSFRVSLWLLEWDFPLWETVFIHCSVLALLASAVTNRKC